MKKNKKKVYETPVLIPLGELARGSGAPPTPPNSCNDGAIAAQNCRGGGGVTTTKPQCKNGSNASTSCLSGFAIAP